MDLERVFPANALRPRWDTGNALVYLGALVVLVATIVLLGILGDLHGDGALVGYGAVAMAAALALALALERRARHVAAGVFATLAVLFLAVAVGSLLNVLGILEADVGDYQPATLLVEAAIVGAALAALRRFRAPLLVLPIALVVWIAIADLGSISSWSETEELLSLAAGALLVAAGVVLDRSGRRPYGMWPHAVGGLAFGGAVLSLVADEGDAGWLLVAVLSLVYVAAAYLFERSSYAVLAVVGILAVTTYFTFDAVSIVGAFLPFGSDEVEEGLEPWQVSLWFVASGLAIVLLGLIGRRLLALRRP